MSSEMNHLPQSRAGAIKSVAWGLAWVTGTVVGLTAWLGNPTHSLKLILRGQTAPGQIVDAWEDIDQDEYGRTHCYYQASYTFSLPGGLQHTATTLPRSGRLQAEFVNLPQPVPVEVEYDPEDPSINRIKGGGSQTIARWLLVDVGMGVTLAALLASPGAWLVRDGVRAYRASPA